MFISDFAIRRPVVTVVSMLALVVFGLFALLSLDTDEYPDVNPPFVFVAVPYPGASPDIVEREVIDPIEEAISGISGVDEMVSSSFDGFGQVLVQFVFEKDVQQASQDIRDAISTIRGDLPQEMEEPILSRWDPNDMPIVSLALSSPTLSAPELTRIADPGVTRELKGLAGVAEVVVRGQVERELTVELRPDALQAAGVGIGQVVQALAAQNLAVPVGRLNGRLEERTIRLNGRLRDPAEFAQLVVAEREGRVIRLGEVATVRDGTEEPRSAALYNGRPAVGIDIIKSQGSSTTDVSQRAVERVRGLQATLPAGVTMDVVQDAGERVSRSVLSVEEALLLGAILTVLVVFLFLNSWRSTVITGLALPVSVLAAFVAVFAFGFTLNTMSLLGLSLAIGILIDDAIVVRENIVRHVEMGKDHYRAAMEGTDEIGLAVAATTFSIVCVFVPIAFMGGMAEQWFAPFALTIACSVLVSLFVSFSLDPMLSAYWRDPHREEHEKGWITRRLDRFNAWFARRAEDYKRVIAWALDHRASMFVIAVGAFFGALAVPATGATGFATVLTISVALAVLLARVESRAVTALALVVGVPAMMVAGFMVPPFKKLGFEFFPKDDRSELYVNVETPAGSNLEYTRLKAEEVAALARARPEVEYTYTTVGAAGTGASTVDQATVYARLVPKHDRALDQHALGEELRRDASRVAGATVSLVTNAFNSEKQIQIEVRGPDVAVLNGLADRVLAEVRGVPGAADVDLSTKGQKPEVEVRLRRGLAGSLGITAAQVAQAVRPAFAGIDAGDWVDPSGETRDVTVRLAPEARSRSASLESLPIVIAGPRGAVTVPLGQIAEVRPGRGPAQIDHLDRDRVINVQANTSGRPLSEVLADINARLRQIRVPDGYAITQGGESEDSAEVFGRIFFALGVAVMLMYLILV
ncbi:MAG TPA: efflux RND transporter permease subunit, partial [Longimicrobiaceae bacterium]|nr:efflux RND transporter permease subunit [Longimicrobiaceae bacterium]